MKVEDAGTSLVFTTLIQLIRDHGLLLYQTIEVRRATKFISTLLRRKALSIS